MTRKWQDTPEEEYIGKVVFGLGGIQVYFKAVGFSVLGCRFLEVDQWNRAECPETDPCIMDLWYTTELAKQIRQKRGHI